MTIAIHCQMCGYDIRVNSIHPGAIDTPMIDTPMIDQTCSDPGIADRSGLSPVGLGLPLDVANVVCSPRPTSRVS